MKQDMILILDLGSEENPRLAREIRAMGVYTEIHPHDISAAELAALPNVKGIILNGGVNRVVDGTWKPEAYWEGLASGWVGLDELSDLCAEGTAEKVEAAKQGIIDGSLVLFSGEIKDQSGAVKHPNGMTNEEIYNMNWFIEGVIGTING